MTASAAMILITTKPTWRDHAKRYRQVLSCPTAQGNVWDSGATSTGLNQATSLKWMWREERVLIVLYVRVTRVWRGRIGPVDIFLQSLSVSLVIKEEQLKKHSSVQIGVSISRN